MDKLVRDSGFHGVLEEYPDVAVDYFTGNSLNCKVFFLSHCHTDHMVGLNSNAFKEKLRSSQDIRLYSSKCTMELLTADYNYAYLKSHMVTYDVHETSTITVPGVDDATPKSFLVTLLPAGHCPGSVMFLFEGYGGTVLHTGDFRLTVDDLKKMNSLHTDVKVKTINKLYLDTTFCCQKVLRLPKRTQSRDLLFKLLDPWLSDKTGQIVFLELPAHFGCEYLFVELCSRYKMKVHVPSKKLWRYKAIPDIMAAVTVDGATTRIHACNSETVQKKGGESCDWKYRSNYIRVRCSTMWFMFNSDLVSDEADNSFMVRENEHKYRLCYSMHSSLKEILEFVRYLRPRAVHPLVVPKASTLENVQDMLRQVPDNAYMSSASLEFDGFGELKNQLLKSSYGCISDPDLTFETQALPVSPPIKRIRRLSGPASPPLTSPSSHGSRKVDVKTPEWSFVVSPFEEPVNSSQEDGSIGTPEHMPSSAAANDSQKSNSSSVTTETYQLPVHDRKWRSNLVRDSFAVTGTDVIERSGEQMDAGTQSVSSSSETTIPLTNVKSGASRWHCPFSADMKLLTDSGQCGTGLGGVTSNREPPSNSVTGNLEDLCYVGADLARQVTIDTIDPRNTSMKDLTKINFGVPELSESEYESSTLDVVFESGRQTVFDTVIISSYEDDDVCFVQEMKHHPPASMTGVINAVVNGVVIAVKSEVTPGLRPGAVSRIANGASSISTGCVDHGLSSDGVVGCLVRRNVKSGKNGISDVPVIDLTEDVLEVTDLVSDGLSDTDNDWGSTPELDFSQIE